MALTSGGSRKWKRKRGTAARLRPVGIDPAATTRLFTDAPPPESPPYGRAARRPRRTPATAVPATSIPATSVPEAHPTTPGVPTGPLVRYEWRTTTGGTLVVEAGWPTPDGYPATTSTTTPPNGGVPVDLRS